MKIIFKDTFISRLERQIDYISKDSPARARKFKNELFNRTKEIPSNPYKYRKSIYFNDIQIRDLIFKGYTIVFRIVSDSIEVFGFVNFQNSPMD
ncbi:MAG: type II toxin-antitoxin system RelE/ParE family toxin [Bacteroidales bacterium]|nr:type II toxin-antitoxin system RelE/ParE family toxin [Bacteroidales bacterium]